MRWETCGAPRADESAVLFDQVACEVGCVHGMGDNEGSWRVNKVAGFGRSFFREGEGGGRGGGGGMRRALGEGTARGLPRGRSQNPQIEV